MFDIMPVIALQRLLIVTNSHADPFSVKIRFDETYNIF